MSRKSRGSLVALPSLLLLLAGCAPSAAEREAPPLAARSLAGSPRPEVGGRATPSEQQSLVVSASAYNSLREQTDETPNLAAWGDELRPGMRVIAISRDLLELGLDRGTRVEIEGLEGTYVVLDRMPSRWTRKIDIYMGVDVQAALDWGVRRVRIRWPAR